MGSKTNYKKKIIITHNLRLLKIKAKEYKGYNNYLIIIIVIIFVSTKYLSLLLLLRLFKNYNCFIYILHIILWCSYSLNQYNKFIVTTITTGYGVVYNFMLEEVMDYGPANIGKFASTYKPTVDKFWNLLKDEIMAKRKMVF